MHPSWFWMAAALAAAPVVETPSVRLPVPLPEGVQSSPVAREMATRARSTSVTFAVEGKPVAADGRLVVRGVLTNEGTRAATVHVVAAPHTGGPFLLQPRGATFRPASEEAPLPPEYPEELVLPPGAKVVYESALVLSSWDWPAEGAEIDWIFQFWDDPASGTLAGRLKPPQAR